MYKLTYLVTSTSQRIWLLEISQTVSEERYTFINPRCVACSKSMMTIIVSGMVLVSLLPDILARAAFRANIPDPPSRNPRESGPRVGVERRWALARLLAVSR